MVEKIVKGKHEITQTPGWDMIRNFNSFHFIVTLSTITASVAGMYILVDFAMDAIFQYFLLPQDPEVTNHFSIWQNIKLGTHVISGLVAVLMSWFSVRSRRRSLD